MTTTSKEPKPVHPPSVLYHGTRPALLRGIVEHGLRSRSGMSPFGHDQMGVSTTTNLDVVGNGNFGNLVLALHTSGLSSLTFFEYQDASVGPEDEIRVVAEGKPETVIPFRHVFALYRVAPSLAGYEVRELAALAPHCELFTLWHGKLNPVSIAQKVAARFSA